MPIDIIEEPVSVGVTVKKEQIIVEKTQPAEKTTAGLPRSIPYLIGNEFAERFSYYGMRAILTVFMTQYLMENGKLSVMSEAEARTWYHAFTSANYLFPIIGAVLADALWGKYKTIVWVSVIYCLGHLVLSFSDERIGLAIGLGLIAIGAGGIKPSVAANVGDQFDKTNKHLLDRVYNYYYFALNLGAFFSTLLTPYLLQHAGPSVAFGLPGFLMIIASLIFVKGKKKYKIIPPAGFKKYFLDVFSREGMKTIGNLSIIYLFVAVFWSLFDQQGSSWVLQANKLDRIVDLRFGLFQYDWLQFELLSSQIQAINPVLILLLLPLFSYVIYPNIEKIYKLTSLRKITAGMFVAASSFAVMAWIEYKLAAGENVSILWQIGAYLLLTISEVMVSVTLYEFTYTQAPNSMKSFVMGMFLLSISLGNIFTALFNVLIENEGSVTFFSGASYFWFFAVLMLVTAAAFILVAVRYKVKIHIQGHK